jgi:hypothetical protein
MNGSRDMGPCRVMALIALLLGAMVTTLLPAYGQQEVDPTWYDPWPAPNTAVVHFSQPREAIHRHQPRVKSVPSSRRTAKSSGKRQPDQRRLEALKERMKIPSADNCLAEGGFRCRLVEAAKKTVPPLAISGCGYGSMRPGLPPGEAVLPEKQCHQRPRHRPTFAL